MNNLGEATLLYNWLNESDAMESNDYGFLLNLFLEINHMVSECPNTPEGRHISRLLQKKSNIIGNKIESLEDTIDVYLTEYFEATPDEAENWSPDEEESEELIVSTETTYHRAITTTYTWRIIDITGPAGTIDEIELQSLDQDVIQEFVDENFEGDWSNEDAIKQSNYQEWADNWNYTDRSDANYNESSPYFTHTIIYEYDEEFETPTGTKEFPVKVFIEVEMAHEAKYEGQEDSEWTS